MADKIIDENFNSWTIPSLVIDDSNPFALKSMARFAELVNQNLEHSVFRNQSKIGKIREAISDLKNLFKYPNTANWSKIEEISQIYPPDEALRIIWTSKDLGVRETVNGALFLDLFYASTKLVISIQKDFRIANISTKVYHNERNINSCFKFIYLLSSSTENELNTSCKTLVLK